MPQHLAAVLFDLDGTLLDHEAASASALRDWLPAYGLSQQDIEAAWTAYGDAAPALRRIAAAGLCSPPPTCRPRNRTAARTWKPAAASTSRQPRH
jgi:beta-phosphoglucomutase-like phosphatase (HAD superfamily)